VEKIELHSQIKKCKEAINDLFRQLIAILIEVSFVKIIYYEAFFKISDRSKE